MMFLLRPHDGALLISVYQLECLVTYITTPFHHTCFKRMPGKSKDIHFLAQSI